MISQKNTFEEVSKGNDTVPARQSLKNRTTEIQLKSRTTLPEILA